MKTLLLAAVATAALALPALAQDQTPAKAPAAQQTQPMKQPAQQTQPMNQSAQPGTQAQAGGNMANMQEIKPSTLDHQQVQQIQQALDKNGFGAGRTDGIWGPETKAALTKFQKSKNMGSANGQLDSSTLSALQLNPDQFGQGAASNSGMNGANAANGAMKGETGANSASTGNSTGAASTGANAANGGMKGAGANSAKNATGAKPGASKTTP